jgi:hypothetical protein
MPADERNEPISRREAIRRTALMLGVAVTPSLLTSVSQAQSAARGGSTVPAYLSARQLATAGAIAERIIPRTDTPGAIDVGVPRFLDLMYGKYLTAEEQRVFAAGLSEMEAAAASAGARSFAELPSAEQDALLTRIARASQSGEKTFFHTIKELTLLGYFTSEPVGKNVLHYDPIPGRFDGCIPIAEVGKVSWTR